MLFLICSCTYHPASLDLLSRHDHLCRLKDELLTITVVQTLLFLTPMRNLCRHIAMKSVHLQVVPLAFLSFIRKMRRVHVTGTLV